MSLMDIWPVKRQQILAECEREIAERKASVLSLTERRKPELLWSPEECVHELLESIKSGKVKPVKMAVHYFEEDEEGGLLPRTWSAGFSHSDEIACAALMLQQAVDHWKR